MTAGLKPLRWVGRSLEDMRSLPLAVRRDVGYALQFAQAGTKHPSAKPLSGFGGAGVLEVVENDDGSTYRAVYTVRFEGVVYVLHVFQKKSRSGTATPKKEIDLVRARLRDAEADYRQLVKGDPK